jgi:hypothetical protein
MELVRTEPRDLAPVIPLPVRFEGNRVEGNRVIEPLDVPAGTRLAGRAAEEPAPGRLARALSALDRSR